MPLVQYICLTAYEHLTSADQALCKRNKAPEIDFNKYSKGSAGEGGSFWRRVLKTLHSQLRLADWPRNASGKWEHAEYCKLKRKLQTAFFRCYGPDGRFDERPRQRKDAPTLADLDRMRSVLTHADYRWTDEWSNKRRHPSLQHFESTVQQQGDSASPKHTEALAALQRIKQYTHKSLDTLTQLTAKHFSLRKRPERFKPKRNTAGAQRSAGVLAGKEPMLEAYYSKQEVSRNEGRVPGRPDVPGAPRAPTWHKIIITNKQLNATQRLLYEYDDHCEMKYDEGAHQITAAVDGATVYATAPPSAASNDVFYEVCHASTAMQSTTRHSD